MKVFSITSLAEIIKADCAGGCEGFISGVAIDSRTIKSGECFFAIKGDNFDGHDFVKTAFEKGAGCAVVSKKMEGNNLLVVDDCVKALGVFAAEWRRRMRFKVIAITGSVGKTTTRSMIYHVLQGRCSVHQATKNFNNAIGLPLTLLAADAEHKVIVTELGTSSRGEISYLSAIAQPDIAVITNVYPVHLEGLGSIEAIFDEKLSICDGLAKEGIVIVNGNFDRLVEGARRSGGVCFTFGRDGRCDVRPENVWLTEEGSEFSVDGTKIKLPLPGRGNIENALAALAVCRLFGVTTEEFAASIADFHGVAMRMQTLQFGKMTVYSDCYNASPASMQNALEILATNSGRGRKVFICGDMAELGSKSVDYHRQLGNNIAHMGIDVVVAVGNNAHVAGRKAAEKCKDGMEVRYFSNAAEACANLDKIIRATDIVLVKGSRAAQLESAVERLQLIFDKKC